jgi:hypothetical protein
LAKSRAARAAAVAAIETGAAVTARSAVAAGSPVTAVEARSAIRQHHRGVATGGSHDGKNESKRGRDTAHGVLDFTATLHPA